ncbi:MAG: glutaredoxin [Bdellovibrionaceae bacterium]|nr:glutaredoxin [Pseudobdellovibrionaceae bacterium]
MAEEKKQKPVKMYTKVPCPFCVAAKRFMLEHGIEFEEIDLTHALDQLQRIKQESGWATVPIIFFGDELIGGYVDLKALWESGQLNQKLYA